MNDRETNKSTFLCTVAGVTFDNKDGENRQDIIRDILEKHGKKNSLSVKGKLKAATYPTTDTATIEVYVFDKLIGYVPKNKIDTVKRHRHTQSGTVLVRLSYFQRDEIYSAKLYTIVKSEPTEKMKYAVNQILKKYPSLEKPEYTFDAYRQFLNDHKGGQVNQLRYKVTEFEV